MGVITTTLLTIATIGAGVYATQSAKASAEEAGKIQEDVVTGQLASQEKLAQEKLAADKIAADKQLAAEKETAEESRAISARAQQIETLANLKAAQYAYRPAPAQPVVFQTPQPVSQRVGIFQSINTAIHRFFGSWV